MKPTSHVGPNLPGAALAVASLDKLHLTADDYVALSRQGSVATEYRRSRAPLFKLRFRLDGRQKVRSLGSDATRARQIALAVSQLQARHRDARERARLIRESGRHLRAGKAAVMDIAHAAGLRFHGLALRHARQKSSGNSRSDTQTGLTGFPGTDDDINHNNNKEIPMTTVSGDDQGFEPPLRSLMKKERSMTRLRTQKTQQWLREAFERQPSDLAVLAGATAELTEIGTKLAPGIKSFLATAPDSPEELNRILPSIDALHKVVRQHERYVRLSHDIQAMKRRE